MYMFGAQNWCIPIFLSLLDERVKIIIQIILQEWSSIIYDHWKCNGI